MTDLQAWWQQFADDQLPDYLTALGRIHKPDWGEYRRCHDWKNHVLPPVRQIWNELPMLAQLAIYAQAEINAANEEWE